MKYLRKAGIWMSHRRLLNDSINTMYGGYLRIIYSYKKSYFEELLNKDYFASIRHKKIETLGCASLQMGYHQK